GDAKAVNTTTHVIDPWPRYVGNRRIPGNGDRLSRAVERYRLGSYRQPAPPLSPYFIGGYGGGGGAGAGGRGGFGRRGCGGVRGGGCGGRRRCGRRRCGRWRCGRWRCGWRRWWWAGTMKPSRFAAGVSIDREQHRPNV